MVKAVVERLENDNVKIDIEVDASEFEKTVEKIYLKNRSQIAIPGFRKGKAPRKIIERFYGEGVFREDAFEMIFPKAYYKSISETGIKPASEPYDVDLVQISSGQNLKFSVKVQVEPKPELGSYKNIEIVKVPDNVTEEEIIHELQNVREEQARWLAKEDGASIEERVNISYTGYLEDDPIELFSGKNRTLILGSDAYMPGFDAHLIGMKAGEQREFEYIIRDDYSKPEFAGKNVTFNVTMNEVKYREIPELDDEFAKDVSEFDTLKELKESYKVKLGKEKSRNSEKEMQAQLLSKISKASRVEIPDNLIENRVSAMIHESDQRTQALFGKTLKELDEVKYISLNEMKHKYKIEAYDDIKTELILSEIAVIEELGATDDEIEDKLPKDFPYAWKSRELENNKDINHFENLKEAITRKKVIDFLMENAVITEKSTNENADSAETDLCCADETEV